MTTQPITYQHLPNPTILYTDVDDGQQNVTLPFPITYYGASYTSVSVGANGCLIFPGGQFVSLGNVIPGLTSTPNAFVAPWWDDLRLHASNGGNIGWQVQGTAPNRTVTFQWRAISRFGEPMTEHVSFQVRFFEGPAAHVEIDYGFPNVPTSVYDATAGMEDEAGNNPFLFAPSNCTDTCTAADFNALNNTRVIVINAPNPEMTGSFGVFPPGALPGASTTGNVVLTNLGTQTATNVVSNVWLSLDTTLDASDIMIGTVTRNLPQGNNTTTVNLTVPPMQPVAVYNVLLQVDAPDSWSEINENDNVIVGPPFATGYEMQPTDAVITNPGAIAPGMPLNFDVEITNNGAPYAGPVTIELWISLDATLDMADTMVGSAVANTTGQAVEIVSVSGMMATVPIGNYRPAVRVDPANAIIEGDDSNNEYVGLPQIISGSDFTVSMTTVTPAVTEVGLPLTVTALASSRGLPFSGQMPFGVYVSPDAVFDPGDQPVYLGDVTFGPGVADVPIDITFPLSALPGDPQLSPGTYTVFVVADPNNLTTEAIEDNNESIAGEVEVLGADLVINDIQTAPISFIGLPFEISVDFENIGVADARSFRYAYYLSENDIIRVTDQQIFVSETTTIASGASASFTDTVTMPTFTSTQTRYLGVIIDIFSNVPETSESNNTRRVPTPISVVFPIPDLVVEIVQTPTSAAAGEDFSVTRILENVGVAPAPSYTYTYYLSEDDAIDPDRDIELMTFSGSLLTGEDDYGIDTMPIPSDVTEGTYYVGIVVDAMNGVVEVDDTNNTAVADAAIPIFEAAIQFRTDTLPGGTIGVPYSAGVYAAGGPLPITWTVSAGALPDGLSIDATSGIISGTPTTDGVFTFTLRASSGTAFATREYSVRIIAPTVELTVATPSLPSGLSGRPYSAQLLAVGGVPPYTWEITNGDLPVGLSFDASGQLFGDPVAVGDFSVRFQVTDDVGDSATKELVIKIITGGDTIQIQQQPLPDAIIDNEYCDPTPVTFEARNGTEPYTWSIVGEGVPGITLSPSGELCGVPTRAGTYSIVVRVQDATALYDTSLFILEVDDGNSLAISTTTLEDAKQNSPYSAQITAILGEQPYQWSIVQGWGALPAGITLGDDGSLSGTPTEAGTFAFAVQVVDAANGSDVQPLSLYVEAAPGGLGEGGDDGCSCATTHAGGEGGEAPLASLSLLVVAGLALVRRRRR